MTNLETRNAEATLQALNDFQARIIEMEQAMIANQDKIGSLHLKLAKLEQELILMRLANTGTGPTAE